MLRQGPGQLPGLMGGCLHIRPPLLMEVSMANKAVGPWQCVKCLRRCRKGLSECPDCERRERIAEHLARAKFHLAELHNLRAGQELQSLANLVRRGFAKRKRGGQPRPLPADVAAGFLRAVEREKEPINTRPLWKRFYECATEPSTPKEWAAVFRDPRWQAGEREWWDRLAELRQEVQDCHVLADAYESADADPQRCPTCREMVTFRQRKCPLCGHKERRDYRLLNRLLAQRTGLRMPKDQQVIERILNRAIRDQ